MTTGSWPKALSIRGSVHSSYGELDQAVPLIEESVRLGEPFGSPELYLVGLFFLGHFHNWQGDFHQAIEIQRRVTREAQSVHDEWNEGLGMWCLGLAHIGCGRYTEARALLDEALAKSRERKSHFNVGRITNSLGWLHQELGDFRGALEFNREAAALGQRHQIGNIEVSAQLDIGYTLVRGGEPGPALSLFEEMVARVENGLGSHRWRWDIRVSVGIAEALLALGRGAEAVKWIERALSTAGPTRSAKYLAKCHALLGERALLAGRWGDAVTKLSRALELGRKIENPTLVWQAAHLLARAQAKSGRPDEASMTARLALDTIDGVAARASDLSLRTVFLAWPRVVAAREEVDRLIRI